MTIQGVPPAVIEQAKGIIMAGRHCTAEQADEVLDRASARSNRTVLDLAERLVDSVTRPTVPVESRPGNALPV